MPGQGRLGDIALGVDGHGCIACVHIVQGPAVQGSTDVIVNGRPAVRKGDMGVHMVCCGPNTWKAQAGSASVMINGKPAHRLGDATKHCGGRGDLIQASANVIVGESPSRGLKKAFRTGAPTVCNCNE